VKISILALCLFSAQVAQELNSLVQLIFVVIIVIVTNICVHPMCSYLVCSQREQLFEEYLGMRRQRWLIAYPIGLLYCCFVLITIF
jgi:hypothetical protein